MANAKILFSTGSVEPGEIITTDEIEIQGLSPDALAAFRVACTDVLLKAHAWASAVDEEDRLQASKNLREAVMAANKKSLLSVMAAHGVEKAVVSYAGGGDSGGVEEIDLPDEGDDAETALLHYAFRYHNSNKSAFIYVRFSDLGQALSEFTEGDLLDHFGHSGYENNEGGFGVAKFFPKGLLGDGEVLLEHSDYIQETEDYEHAL